MSKICIVCDKENSSYKCPSCQHRYCSINCCKLHKETNCAAPVNKISNDPNKPVNLASQYDFATVDTVPIEKLSELKDSKEVTRFAKDPYMQKIIKNILDDPNPTEAIAQAMLNPLFVEMANACLKVVEPPNENDFYNY